MNMPNNTIIDADGDRWPVTGFYCDICGLPMQAVNVPFGTHPNCVEEER